MGRSKDYLKRKTSSRSKDPGFFAKRHSLCTTDTADTSKNDNFSQSTTDASRKSFYDSITYNQVPYHSWLTYFYNEEYNEKSATVAKIDVLIEFFEKNASATFDVEKGWNLDINSCIDDCNLRQKWPNIVESINVNPHHTMNCINAAFFEVMMRRMLTSGMVERSFRILRLNRVNIINYQSLNPLPYVTFSSYGKLISIGGSVIGIERPKLSSDTIVYACKCNRHILFKPQKKTSSISRKCNVCGNNGRITRVLDSLYETTKISQTIYIKNRTVQMVADETISPNIISVNLTSSLVDKFMPGDKIRIIGIPRVTRGAVKSSTSGSYPLYVDTISAFQEDDISPENSNIPIKRCVIERIKSEPNVLSLLVNSLCPSVQGHAILKASLILGLFAGTFKTDEIRDYIHILIIGNLGLGKSQLLRACVQVAPEGTYIRGSSTTSLGSTINAAVRENPTDNYRFDAGPLALANRGLCCLDELDKMSNQHQIIYNVMIKRRMITMNSELRVCLPARTPIFAMTNATMKRYDPSKTVVENVNASPQLLTQFDLILLMQDNPNTYLDKLMCDRVLDEHRKRTRLTEQTQSSNCREIDECRANVDRTLRENLITPNESSKTDILPENLFRMYVNYAKMFVKPKMTNVSRTIIERFCLLRHRTERDFVKIERYLRTLTILTEARAKIDLRDETTEQDAYDAIEILSHSMSIDSKDLSQKPSSSSNSNKVTANKVKEFMNDLENEAQLLDKCTFTIEELRNIAGRENIVRNTFLMLLSKLNEQGYLLKVSTNLYKAVFR